MCQLQNTPRAQSWQSAKRSTKVVSCPNCRWPLLLLADKPVLPALQWGNRCRIPTKPYLLSPLRRPSRWWVRHVMAVGFAVWSSRARWVCSYQDADAAPATRCNGNPARRSTGVERWTSHLPSHTRACHLICDGWRRGSRVCWHDSLAAGLRWAWVATVRWKRRRSSQRQSVRRSWLNEPTQIAIQLPA